ncbi:unnamed protein product [Dracunculus medinensis]|uniref:MIT domain-containing protein n=1 Tax=Dracunculus medinensis TaxID=318479 RepID=A0A0N4U245_DRAME|nr:unnamed protein product [Dracunculus medinensis]
MQAIIEKSKPVLQNAVAFDRDGKRPEAIQKYIDGVTLLMDGLSCEYISLDDKGTLRGIISKYMARAEKLKGQSKVNVVSVDRIHIKENSTGHGYEEIFSRCFDDSVTEIRNFIHFCEICYVNSPKLSKIRLKTLQQNNNARDLNQFGECLSEHGVQLQIIFDEHIHDREIV